MSKCNGLAVRRRGEKLAVMAASALAALALQLASIDIASADETAPMFMFVHVADNFTADPDAGTLRLVNVSPQVLYFSDRPQRIAGHMKLPDYLKEWSEGKDNFGDDPPNATLSVYEPGQGGNTLVVVELTNPVIDGRDIVYTCKVLDGSLPREGGATALFIDAIGIGGGVGIGYHGVGVGRRGPGYR